MRNLGMPRDTQKQSLTQLLASVYADGPIDVYNQEGRVRELEQRVARLLNKPACLFFPKGTVAQLCALKVSAEQRENDKLVLHSMSHMVLDEDDAYQTLLGLKGITVGDHTSPFTMQDVAAIKETFATLCVELPIRRAGFKLTQWDQLALMSQWCKTKHIHFHMDGARLWESTSYYKRTEADICALFDSVYVSLYKGLGAIGGAVLAGETNFIERCKVWRSRLGGNAFTSFPMVIGALEGLDNRLKHMPEWVRRAKKIASLLEQFPQLEINTPQTNGFFVFIEGNIKQLTEKATKLNQAMGIKLFNQFCAFPKTTKLMIEIQVGVNHGEISDQEIVDYFSSLCS